MDGRPFVYAPRFYLHAGDTVPQGRSVRVADLTYSMVEHFPQVGGVSYFLRLL